jgi:hypothetical protein
LKHNGKLLELVKDAAGQRTAEQFVDFAGGGGSESELPIQDF